MKKTKYLNNHALKIKNGRRFLPLLFALLLCSSYLQGQVTIGSDYEPIQGALLDLKSTTPSSPTSVTDDENVTSTTGGLVLPRVKLKNRKTLEPFIATATNNVKITHAGLTIYNIYESPLTETDADKTFVPGIYSWDGGQWNRMSTGDDSDDVDGSKFFYLPSFNLPVSTLGSNKTVDLYNDVYVKQFTKSGNSLFLSSNTTLAEIPGVLQADELDFVVTWYDNSVITVNSISAAGVMEYTVLNTSPSVTSFINIVLVKK